MLTQNELDEYEDRGKMVYIVDIDDTIIDFETQKPIGKMWDLIAHFNKVFKDGNYIYINTARDKSSLSYTIDQLKNIGMKYNEIVFNKIKSHILIDDTAINPLLYMTNPVYYDMLYKRYVKYIIDIHRKRRKHI